MPEYSVVTPATSSLSASGMSKGMRLDSASMDKKKMRKAGSPGMIGHSANMWCSCCQATIPLTLIVPLKITGTIATSTSGTS